MSTTPPVPPPPPSGPNSTGAPPPAGPVDELSGPAVGLMITGIVGGLWAFVGLFGNMLGFGLGSLMDGGGPEERIVRWVSGGMGIASSALGLAVAGFLIYVSLEMRKLSQWGLAVGASIVAMVPCVSPCCILGLPIGIWSLVTLQKPHIKQAFR